MSSSLFLFDEEEFQPSSKRQREAARKEIEARKAAEEKKAEQEKEEEKKTVVASTPPPTVPTIEEEEILLPERSEKQYYTISEVAKIFKLNVSHIRHWTTEFQLRVRKNKKGDRLYTHEQIGELKKIYSLMRHEGLTTKGARAKLELDKDNLTRTELAEALLQLKAQLQALLQQVEA